MEFPLDETKNYFIISIYDYDNFGTNVLVANQIIPLDYFRDSKRKGKKFQF